MGSLQLAFTVNYDPPPGGVAGQGYVRKISRNVLVDLVGGKYVQTRTIELSDSDAPPVEAIFAFDGEVEYCLVPELGLGYATDRPNLRIEQESPISVWMMLNPPQPDGLGFNDGSLESLVAHGVLRDSLEEVEGSLCYVVDAFHDDVHYATVWLDAARDLLPVRRVVNGNDGLPTSVVTVHSAVSFDNPAGGPVWLPYVVTTEATVAGQTYTAGIEVPPEEGVDINPPTQPQDFQISFPPGTTVANHITGETFVIDQAGEPVLVTLDPGSEPATKPEQRPAFNEQTSATEQLTELAVLGQQGPRHHTVAAPRKNLSPRASEVRELARRRGEQKSTDAREAADAPAAPPSALDGNQEDRSWSLPLALLVLLGLGLGIGWLKRRPEQ